MNIPSSLPRLKGYRFPREIVAYAVWVYHRFALSTADVEDLLADQGLARIEVEKESRGHSHLTKRHLNQLEFAIAQIGGP